MNRVSFLAALAALAMLSLGTAPEVSCQEREVAMGYALWPSVQAGRVTGGIRSYSSLASVFAPLEKAMRMTGTFSVETVLPLGGRWSCALTLSGNHLYDIVSRQDYPADGDHVLLVSTERRNGNSLALLPLFRLDYLRRGAWRLYGGVGLGLGYYQGYDCPEGRDRSWRTYGEFQVIPAGVRLGRSWFVLLEAGAGTQFIGGRIGAGYRF